MPTIIIFAVIVTTVRIAIHLRQSQDSNSQSTLAKKPLEFQSEKSGRLNVADTQQLSSKSPNGLVATEAVKQPGVAVAKRKKPSPKRVVGTKTAKTNLTKDKPLDEYRIQPILFFLSLGGTTEKVAKDFQGRLNEWISQRDNGPSTEPSMKFCEVEIQDLSCIEYDDYFVSPPKGDPDVKYFYLVVVPSYDIDSVMDSFLEHLKETHHDFRVDTSPLSGLLGYSVFGFGDRQGWPTEEEGFCSQAKDADRWLAKLTGKKRAYPVGMGDVKSDGEERIEQWRSGVQDVLTEVSLGQGLGEGAPGSGDAVESDEEDDDVEEDEVTGESIVPTKGQKKKQERVDDLEDLGGMLRNESASDSKGPVAIDFTTYGKSPKKDAVQATAKEMVPKTSPTYAALTKQGYTIVGSHSGVKICRWMKSALRGRGSCYKHSFYNIESHLCMESTPSLSCSNKCVFCWRHGTNPVGTTWRWQVDPPDLIFAGVKEGHYKKIKILKGMPGVRAERFAEAMRIRHCALSLVGEPIFYPHINEFLSLLHAERISSFLVCNAQHPDQLATLAPVTQLYVSIDASNRETLRKIDRPLHRDFWERFERCMDILRERRFEQRTVFRLTLVKGFNVDEEAEGYADLVARALPCFIEIKGVTFCGTSTSKSAGLTMQNVPWYEEVCEFVRALDAALARRGLDYGIAAEHAHSCCVLLASERFKKDGKWHTWIDYEKFFQCLESGKPFRPEDYMGEPTPEWALWGNGGFDPRDERWYRKKRRTKEEVLAQQA
jgi:tRNA wybutosine-synthesizing protein 1